MKGIHIPPAALEAGARAAYAQWVSVCVTSGGVEDEYRTWDQLEDVEREEWCDQTRASFEAMVAEWPGMDTIMLPRMMQPGHFVPQDYIRLPLMENPDDKS